MDITRSSTSQPQHPLTDNVNKMPDELKLIILAMTVSDTSAKTALEGLEKAGEVSERLKRIIEHEPTLRTFKLHQQQVMEAQERLPEDLREAIATPEQLSQTLRANDLLALSDFIELNSLGNLSESDQMQLLGAARKQPDVADRHWLTSSITHQLPMLHPEVQRQLVYSVMQHDRQEIAALRTSGESSNGFHMMQSYNHQSLNRLAQHFSHLSSSEQQRLFSLLIPADGGSPHSAEAVRYLAAAANQLSPAQQQKLFDHGSKDHHLWPMLAAGVAHFTQSQVDQIASTLLAAVDPNDINVVIAMRALTDGAEAMGAGITRLSTSHIEQMSALLGDGTLPGRMRLYQAMAPLAKQVSLAVHEDMLLEISQIPHEHQRFETLAALNPHILQFSPEDQDTLVEMTLSATDASAPHFAAFKALGEHYPALSENNQMMVFMAMPGSGEMKADLAGLISGMAAAKGRLASGSIAAENAEIRFPWSRLIEDVQEVGEDYAAKALQAISHGLNEMAANYLAQKIRETGNTAPHLALSGGFR